MGCEPCRTKIRAHKLGVSVSETTNETNIAAASVIENSRKSFSTSPPINKIETNTATSDRFIASNVKPTSLEPFSAARNGESPRSMCREIFSSTTIASSTTRPAATISAMSERLFSEKPYRYMIASVPISETGIARHGINAARALPRKRNTTSITRPEAIANVFCDSRNVPRMPGERSITTSNPASTGTSARNAGNCALMASIVAMMFAPG